jgi:small-conductance mechanosensitive channel
MAVRRANLDEHVATSIQTILYYALLVLVVVFALDMMHVPLTAFALFGGALAIGVGFGAQNLIGNFLSGLILLIERPIRLGDIIDIDGERGRVVKIGARCCQVRLFTGGDVMLPNSRFLERKLLNWTLTDFEIQFSIKVGVPYGSPVREVTRLLLQAVNEPAAVLTRPEPKVMFTEFGPAALMFEALFWLEMKGNTDARLVSSDIRFRVEELFREAGIAMVAPPPEAPRPPSAPGP